ncbi:MAG: leucine-rich repeat protein [Clostridia bacterium]|nr:leucine-rich repeat protein [Clostridia bacterium]
MKRVLSLLVCLLTLLPLCLLTAGAKTYEGRALDEEWIAEHYTGQQLTPEEVEAFALAEYYRVTYTLDTETGALKILCGRDENGNKIEQKMLPYAKYEWIPWQHGDMLNSIKTVYIEEGILSVGRYSFYLCESVEEVYIPHSVRKIDRTTFYQCENLKTVHYAGNSADFWSRVNFNEVRNWYAVDMDGDGVEQADEVIAYFKDKIVFGESVRVVCKNQDGDEITSYTVGGYAHGEKYAVTAPVLEGLTYLGEQTEFSGTFKRHDSTVLELIYHCDHEYAVADPAKPCGSFCKHCGRIDPNPPVEHEWGETEIKSERGFLTPLDQVVKCKVCEAKISEYKLPYAPNVCIAVAGPILLARIVFAIVYPIRKKRKMRDLTW